jgi:hypothetical protein
MVTTQEAGVSASGLQRAVGLKDSLDMVAQIEARHGQAWARLADWPD